ncbi:MAG TPA: hypothetical protein VD835_05220 [Pyrinomonadaceae bacterium]|nr:hypothetical protein [Pyrinomonadaceae bacterium]
MLQKLFSDAEGQRRLFLRQRSERAMRQISSVVLQKIFWLQLVELKSQQLPQYLVQSESFCNTTERTLEGIGAVNMMRKGQVKRLSGNDVQGQAEFISNLFQVAA